MPRKFKKYLPKGYSRKGFKQVEDELGDSESQPNLEVETTESGSQTDDFGSISVETQTETVDVKSAATQTDDESLMEVQIETDESRNDDFCIGNSDEKFAALVAKHDGVFKDASGKLKFIH